MEYIVRVNKKEYCISIDSEQKKAKLCDKDYSFDISPVDEGDFYSILIDNKSFAVSSRLDDTILDLKTGGEVFNLIVRNIKEHKALKSIQQTGASDLQRRSVRSIMPGRILKIFIRKGDQVKKDSPLYIIEAMKMENEVHAEEDFYIDNIFFHEGKVVNTGDELFSIRPTN